MPAAFDEATPVEDPFRKKRGTKVDGGDAGPIEDPFGEPVILSGVAGRFAAGRCLRHIHDGFDASFFGRLGKVRGALKNAGLDGKDKVGASNAVEGSADGFKVAEISEDDLCALFS